MAAAPTTARRPPARRAQARRRTPPPRTAIRWDRVGRVALLCVLAAIVLLYVPPVKHWIEQSRTAAHERQDVRDLQREHDRLSGRLNELRRPDALEREARRLGMVRPGERPYVVRPTP
jgi:cell division protein FtsB